MRLVLATVIALAACGGSQDAPRPIADPPVIRDSEGGLHNVESDDDGDGVPNDHDLCPLAAEREGQGFDRDGCPADPVDAGAAPI